MDDVITQTIGGKEYHFKMTNRTIRKIDEKYGNYAKVAEGLMEGKQFYTNALKLVSVCCIDVNRIVLDKEKNIFKDMPKEWDIEELEDLLTPAEYREITNTALLLFLNYMGINVNEAQEAINETEKKLLAEEEI